MTTHDAHQAARRLAVHRLKELAKHAIEQIAGTGSGAKAEGVLRIALGTAGRRVAATSGNQQLYQAALAQEIEGKASWALGEASRTAAQVGRHTRRSLDLVADVLEAVLDPRERRRC